MAQKRELDEKYSKVLELDNSIGIETLNCQIRGNMSHEKCNYVYCVVKLTM